MKLNTEFRVFYDFTEKKILKTFNYWDRKTMQTGIYDENDLKNFNECINDIEEDCRHLKPILEEMVADKMKHVELDGIWSVDFMWDGQKFWLIDAAIGSQSYFYEEIE